MPSKVRAVSTSQPRNLLRLAFHTLISVVLVESVSLPCATVALAADDGKPLRVGFVYAGASIDAGWNHAHDVGRLQMEKDLKGHVITTKVENVPESAACERVMEKMIAQGNKLIFATSYGYLEPMLRVAKRHPDVRFMHCGRPVPPSKNVGSYFSSGYYKCNYAAGVVAGRMTKTNKLGYVGGHPIAALLWSMNAFVLGAKSVNPKAKLQVVWINSWEDPAMESESARGLIENGCDVLNSNLNTSMTVCRVAEKSKKYSCATNLATGTILVKQGWLTGQAWNWGPMYVRVARSVIDQTWKPGDQRYGLEEGYATLAPFGDAVPKAVKDEALAVMSKLKADKLDVFSAPLKDRDGKVRLPAGAKGTAQWLDNMDFFVTGVEGTLPKKK